MERLQSLALVPKYQYGTYSFTVYFLSNGRKKREDIASCLLVGGHGVLSVSFEKERQTDLVIDPVKELVLEGIRSIE